MKSLTVINNENVAQNKDDVLTKGFLAGNVRLSHDKMWTGGIISQRQ